MEQLRLKDKVIVISGGTKGVGKAFAEACGREGAKVVIGGRDEASGSAVVSAVEADGSEALFVPTDLLKVDDCRNLLDKAYERFGRIDGFFN